jgi:hypothetical protein
MEAKVSQGIWAAARLGWSARGRSFGISSDVWFSDQFSLRAVSRPLLVFLRRRR